MKSNRKTVPTNMRVSSQMTHMGGLHCDKETGEIIGDIDEIISQMLEYSQKSYIMPEDQPQAAEGTF